MDPIQLVLEPWAWGLQTRGLGAGGISKPGARGLGADLDDSMIGNSMIGNELDDMFVL